ncbi:MULTISPECIES: iron uptake porin [Nostoc]|uniref:Iron uptake porin n=2 Tax=Nostoc TaxID=1177 RepID=A0ABR8I352_9NOSO|nr:MULTISPECIES: iron uptake porin [Nostoc]MBD2559415.1 iron uptake porin [Nostoc linckia FACHB-391]MBD2645629.1 iron uptake porin [Nostoc foliaceum FACHB-393]
MTKRFWNLFKVSPVVVAAAFFVANSALAAEVNEEVTNVAQLSEAQDSNNMSQVTSVSQFSDVQPTDWAFQALQSLVERYGCIAGYPNSTYRGNRALTRYEFAAGLNACLDRVNELIATATADLVSKQDLATLQRLQEEFSAELATLRGRVDAVEARTAELEANQFSTTTKLVGEAIFNVTQAFGDKEVDGPLDNDSADNDDLESNTTFANRVRLNLYSSFTGTDQLQIRLSAGNIFNNSAQTGTNMTRLGFEQGSADNANSVGIDKANYAFNFGEAIRVKIDATGAELYENVNNFNPDFASSARGAISRYGRFSPIYRQGSGGAGLTVTFNPKGPISLSGAYLAPNAQNPGGSNGVFNGDSTIFGQIGFQPTPAIGVGLTYARSYQDGGLGDAPDIFGDTGSILANNLFEDRVESNHYGVQLSFKPSSKLTVGGWAGFSDIEAKNLNAGQSTDVFYWAATLALKDFGREGSLLGFIFGQSPKVTDSNIANGVGGEIQDIDTAYHAEALYRLQVSDNIAVTPGLLVIFNPDHNDVNDTIYVGTLRTTFTF